MTRALTVLVFMCLPLTAAAQRIVVTPTVGAFVPLRGQGPWDDMFCGSGGCESFVRRASFSRALSTGFKIAVEGDGWLGIEASLATTATDRRTWTGYAADPEESFSSDPAHNTMVGLRLNLRQRLSSRADFAIGAGPSLTVLPIHPPNVDARPGSYDRTRWGATMGVTLRVAVNPALRFETSVTNNTYAMLVGAAGAPSYRQHDLVVAAGVSMVLDPDRPRLAAEPGEDGPGWLARAAARTRITPVVGGQISLARHGQWTMPDDPGPKMGETHRVGLDPGVSAGVKAVFHGDGWLGVEASVTTASLLRRDDVSLSPAVAFSEPPPLTPLLASARTTVDTVRLLARKRLGARGDVAVGLGPALIKVSSEALDWDRFSEPPQRNVWGASTSAALGVEPVRGVRGELSVVHHTYVLRYDSGHYRVATTTARQHDVVIAAGLGLALGR